VDLVVGPWGARPVAGEIAVDAAPAETGPFACVNCGAVLRFSPGTEELRCTYCGHVTRIDAAPAVVEEQDFDDAVARVGDAAPPSGEVAASCAGCGAGFTFAPPLHAGSCPFCGQSVVVPPDGALTPTGLLPFLVGEEQARAAVTAWLGKLWFAPGRLRTEARGRDALRGLYVPHFTFDSETETAFRGMRGDVYYETRRVPVVVDGRRTTQLQQVPKVRWRPASGRVARRFDDVLVGAGTTLPEALVARLRGFDTHEARAFQGDFLVGFESERYQLGLGDGFARARELMRRVIQGDVRARIGGDMQRITAMDVRHRHRAFKLLLLPLWCAELRFVNRRYRVLVNGRTGEVVGERPWSFWKVAAAAALALVVAAGLVALVLAAPAGPPAL
jgi:DNA-directed RNA polymerase subunit RPC12/RpoP